MKKIIGIILTACLMMGCAYSADPTRYNTQRGAAIGAGLGAIAGQAIGQNTESTLIGTGVGALFGGLWGNGIDQQYDASRQQQSQSTYQGPSQPERSNPPGEWVKMRGHWQGNHWVPEHWEWRPLSP